MSREKEVFRDRLGFEVYVMLGKRLKDFFERFGKSSRDVRDEYISNDFSWWTPIKKFVALGALGVAFWAGGNGVYRCHMESRMQEAHARNVAEMDGRYGDLDISNRAADSCLPPGGFRSVVRDSEVRYGVDLQRDVFNASESRRSMGELCIRNTDGGQDISLESRAKISGLTYGEAEGLVSFRTGLEMLPEIPDILPYDISFQGLRIGSKQIPIDRIVEHAPRVDRPFTHYSVDIRALADEGLLGPEDFEDGLDVRVRADIAIRPVSAFDREDIAGLDAYSSLPVFLQVYTLKTDRFPTGHERIRSAVDGYRGPEGDVMGFIDYAMRYVADNLDYCGTDGADCSRGRQLPVIETLEQGGAVCSGYTKLFVTLCRAYGIPARYVGNITFNNQTGMFGGRHAWAEVALPFVDGSYRWITVEPTGADNAENMGDYINYTDSSYRYDLDFRIGLDTGNTRRRYGIVQETLWNSAATEEASVPADDGAGTDSPGTVEGYNSVRVIIGDDQGGMQDE